MADMVKTIAKKSEIKPLPPVLASKANHTLAAGSYSPSLNPVFSLHQSMGNQALQRMYRSRMLQAKLKISQPGDIYEQEADRVADQVMRMPDTTLTSARANPAFLPTTLPKVSAYQPGIQRQQLQDDDHEGFLQAKEGSGSPPTIGADLSTQISSLKGNGRPLSQGERAFFEPRFGYDFSGVRVHTDSQAAELARGVNARAFTLGRDVVFGAGEHRPGSFEGKRLMAHELGHVVQQNSRREVLNGVFNIAKINSNYIIQREIDLSVPVNDFINKIKNYKLINHGQFYFSRMLFESLSEKIDETCDSIDPILRNQWLTRYGNDLKNEIHELLSLASTPSSLERNIKNKRDEILRNISNSQIAINLRIKKKLVLLIGKNGNSSKINGEKIFGKFRDYFFTKDAGIPESLLQEYHSIDKLQSLVKYENTVCGTMEKLVAYFYLKKGGLSSKRKGKTPPPFKTIELKNGVIYHPTNPSGLTKGEEVTYNREKLDSAIKKIKKILDDGFMVRVFVSSGKYARGIHYLLILGYEGNKFVFWDSDAFTSLENFGGGFGFLYYDTDKNRFSTARNDSDFLVDSRGFHQSEHGQINLFGPPEPRPIQFVRHRYQVLTISEIY